MIEYGEIVVRFQPSIREALRGHNVPADQVDLITDLVIHAVSEAMQTVDRVAGRAASPAQRVCIQSVAWPLLEQLARLVTTGLIEAARATGMAVTPAMVSAR